MKYCCEDCLKYKVFDEAFSKNCVDGGTCDYCGATHVKVADVTTLRDSILKKIEKEYSSTDLIEGFHNDLDGTYIDYEMIDPRYHGCIRELHSPMSIHQIMEFDYDELDEKLAEDIFEGYEDFDYEDYIDNEQIYGD
ncbi:MAG: hypothetical protein J5509_02520 [Lachnospiraceae bacterium]|nr:hypothetical protein [Lachnospiraceae bacterium]